MIGGRLGLLVCRRDIAAAKLGVPQRRVVEIVAALILTAVAAHALLSYCFRDHQRASAAQSPPLAARAEALAMILYGSSLSPYVRKVLAFAAEKGMELELRPTGEAPGQPAPEFLAASPLRKMPALVDGDYTLAESTAIVHYLEARQPEPSLIPAEAELLGKTIWFDEFRTRSSPPAARRCSTTALSRHCF
jgi:hypothetical protein